MASKEQSKAIANLKKSGTGGYDRMKKTEARAGGRELYGGIRDGVAVLTAVNCKLDRNNKPGFIIKGTTIEPDDLKGVYAGLYYNLADDNFNSAEQNQETFLSRMKLIGLDDIIDEGEDFAEVVQAILEYLENAKIYYRFNTKTKPDKHGKYWPELQGLSDDYNEGEEAEEDEAVEDEDGGDPEEEAGEEETEEACPFEVGDKVETTGDPFQDGSTWEGEVKTIDVSGQECNVLFSDGEDSDISWSNLRITSSSQEKAEGEWPFEVGDMVKTVDNYYHDGEIYVGEVTKLTKTKATVVFEDGDEDTIALDKLELDS